MKIHMTVIAGAVCLSACATMSEEERAEYEAQRYAAAAAEYEALAEGDAGERDEEGRICRVDGVTGTRLRNTRTCLTAAEWDARAVRQREEADRLAPAQGFMSRDSDGQ